MPQPTAAPPAKSPVTTPNAKVLKHSLGGNTGLDQHENALHDAVARAAADPHAHTPEQVEDHLARLHSMDPPAAIKVASRVTGAKGLRRKDQAIEAVRAAIAPPGQPQNWAQAGSPFAGRPAVTPLADRHKRPAPPAAGPTATADSEFYKPDVERCGPDGCTTAARVGVPAQEIPDKIPLVPNLTARERAAEGQFKRWYEKDPDGAANKFLRLVQTKRKPGMPVEFGTDDAKELSKHWSGEHMSLEERAHNRATLNVALHQTANAIAKRAFLKHLDNGLKTGEINPGDEVLVTCGGCGAGKGYALKKVKPALEMKQRAKAVWDSAGDQNATENPWIQQELEKRGLKGNYLYVHADPRASWAHPAAGVLQRAQNPEDGRMVGAKVFADSYAIGAQNHHRFYMNNRHNPNANFIFLNNQIGRDPEEIPGVPPEALSIDRHHLTDYAVHAAAHHPTAPDHIKAGALADERIWGLRH